MSIIYKLFVFVEYILIRIKEVKKRNIIKNDKTQIINFSDLITAYEQI